MSTTAPDPSLSPGSAPAPVDSSRVMPTLYICHGAGPCFFMEWTMGPPDSYVKMEAWLRGLAATLPTPKAIVVISGHWEEGLVTVTSTPRPGLIYDYYGFPEHTYRLKYPAPGAPDVAHRITRLLGAASIPYVSNSNRGLDHGVFVPFLLVYPEAQIPIVQVSMRSGYDPHHHLQVGRALAPLRSEGILIVGSGASYHNRRGAPESKIWDDWLTSACMAPAPERDVQLLHWTGAPHARLAHPMRDWRTPRRIT
jgi:aromatic ring-opening dioxygenase catalytic subunit (LigB family)